MIRLFVSDIDGCLSEAYRPYDIPAFSRLAAMVADAGGLGDKPGIPAFSLCSGRAFAYVEAMTQLLGISTPVLFEAGGGIFDPVAVRV
ncbi:MAG TPA: HAD family phosphatase, partial [Rhodothermales bacterium]